MFTTIDWQTISQQRLAAYARTAGVLCLLINCATAATVAGQCVTDLEAIPGFLLENDTGAKEELAQWGQTHFDTALAKAREDSAQAPDVETCNKALNGYLKAWRNGHLAIVEVAQATALPEAARSDSTAAKAAPSLAPSIRSLSGTTVVLTIPSFAPHTAPRWSP